VSRETFIKIVFDFLYYLNRRCLPLLHPFNRLFGIGDKSDPDSKSESDEQSYNSDEVIYLPIKNIEPNRYQPREIFNEEKIKELAQTIHTHGMIQPIVVRRISEENFELIAGERRWRAVQVLEWEEVPAIIRDMTDTETASVALI